MTLIELIFFLLNIGLGVLGSMFGGKYFGLVGYIGGFIVGALSLFSVGTLLAYLEGQLYSGRPEIPPCRTEGSSDYRVEQFEGQWVRKCPHCGKQYRKKGRRFQEVMPGGAIRPFLIWRAFRGWFPEEDA
ncbi:MAG: hypothetical protein ABFD92_08730 [Planctomycetaceae bacterium]|nr:hypothetical protein [Planctomycetaceae bacterium]